MTSRLLAYYLPQYHPIPENNKWWGDGFTEWTNVTKAKPLFRDHYQPRYPADLGYYDLRVPEIREQQAAMAKAHGIEGFVYYHYWFGNGKKLLERPFQEVLQSRKPDFPFCLCWANESWKGVWHGEFTGKTLIEQTYPGRKDFEAHFYHLLPAFADERYIKVDGKPVFNVYLPLKLPDLKMFVDVFNNLAIKEGFSGMFLIASRCPLEWNPLANNFDGVIGSEIMQIRYGKWNKYNKAEYYYIKKRIENILFNTFSVKIKKRIKPLILEYKEVINDLITDRDFDFDYYPCVIPNWDNTARVGKHSIVFHNSTPELFQLHLKAAIKKVQHLKESQRFIFIKSWNEWAEGNYLEPDKRFGYGYLEKIKECLC